MVLREGFRAVQENVRSLAIYALIVVVFISTALVAGQLVDEDVREAPLSLFSLTLQAIGVLVEATAQTIAFTWMGQRLGRPLWKLSLREGVHEFFGLWLVLQTIVGGLWLSCFTVASATGDYDLGFGLLLACTPVLVLTIPVGACVMHQGRVSSHAVRSAFHTLAEAFPQTLALLLFQGVVFFFVLILQARTVDWAAPLVGIIDVYFNVVVFGAAWTLCVHHEQSFDDDDLDF